MKKAKKEIDFRFFTNKKKAIDNRRNIRRWVTALESGRFKQCKFRLSNGTEYCCIGVACKIFLGKPKVVDYKYFWEGHDSSMPDSLNKMLALRKCVYVVGTDAPYIGKNSQRLLMRMNDTLGYDFVQIAQFIRERFELETGEAL